MAHPDSVIRHSTLQFLSDLQENNHRAWFHDHKERYEDAHTNAVAFTTALIREMEKHDHLVPRLGTQSLFRIYRDVRFSNDKTPYKTAFSGRMKRATKWLRGGYYFRIAPHDQTAIMGGFWRPNSADLQRIRQEIEADPGSFRRLFADSRFKRNFGSLQGDEVKTAPRGYTRAHPDIDLLRKKQFLLIRTFPDEKVLSPAFLRSAVQTFLAMRPFFDHMSEVLTTNANGEPIG
ncbi:MAG: DUF2461 domain-containing protein [Saprospiraceae bacterium]|nr:DUF2461 domain-containing protein [Saprospiraceae bacterium]